jgi:hypothetical protein
LAVVDVPEGVGVEALPVRVGGGGRTRVPRGGLTGKVHVLLIDVSGIAIFLRPAAVGGVGVLYPRKGTPQRYNLVQYIVFTLQLYICIYKIGKLA